MNIVTNYLRAGHRYRPGTPSNMQYVTIHSTGNPTSTAKNERAWLDNPTNLRKASYHYVVDMIECIGVIPESEDAWHSGSSTGNHTSIGVEICESGNREQTLQNAAVFVAGILTRRGWGVDRLRRHYDWSGKECPRIMMANSWAGWTAFKARVAALLISKPVPPKPVMNPYPVASYKWIQFQLNKAGYNLVVDGIIGAKSIEAIRAFQKSKGLVVDGIVGPKTIAALSRL